MLDRCDICDDAPSAYNGTCVQCFEFAKAVLVTVMELEDRQAGNKIDLATVLDMALDRIGIASIEIES